MEKIKRFFLDKNLWISFALVMVLFASLYSLEFSRCTYRMYDNDYMVEYEHHLTNGRTLTAIFWRVVNDIGLSINQTYLVTYILAIIMLTLSCYKMHEIAKRVTGKEYISIIISALTVLNPFVVDLLIYIEKGMFMVSICTTIYAISFMLDYFETHKKRNILYSLLLLFVSVFCYQGTSPLFICICVIFALKYSKSILEFIRKNLLIAITFIIPYATNFLYITLLHPTPRIGELTIVESSKKVFETLPNFLITTNSVMPKYVFISMFLILMFGFIVYGICALNDKYAKIKEEKATEDIKKEKKKKLTFETFKNIFGYIYVIVLVFAVVIIPQIAMNSNYSQLVPRSAYSIGAILGVILLYFYSIHNSNKIFNSLVLVSTCIYFVIETVHLQALINDHYALNELDKATAMQIQNEITKYEENTGKKIEYVCYYQDKNVTRSYPGLISYGEINEKVASMYCNIHLLNYYSNRDYQLSLDRKQENEAYFSTKDWDYFDKEQIIFDENVACICEF